MENGELRLTTTTAVAALDLTVKGVSQSQLALMLSGSDYQMKCRAGGDGVRLVIFSPTGKSLPAGTTTLLRLASSSAQIEAAQIASPEATNVPVALTVPTGISETAAQRHVVSSRWFTTDGRPVSGQQVAPGVYVLEETWSDGKRTTRKAVKK